MDAPTTAHPLPAGLRTETLVTSYFDRDALGVVGINVCDLIDLLFPEYWGNFGRDPEWNYAAVQARIHAWCVDHGCHYYARGRHEFDTCEAATEAVALGLRRVVLEDLS